MTRMRVRRDVVKKLLCAILTVPLLLCGCGRAEDGTDRVPTQETVSSAQPTTEEMPVAEHIPYPKEDEPVNVFFVSNSTCYYFTDELYGLLTAAGYQDVTLALVYYSGCPIKKHHQWLLEGAANYQFRVLDRDGLHVYENYSLENALQFRDWDIISFDNNARSFASGDTQTALAEAEPYFGDLLGRIKETVPNARYFWHEVWANEIGYNLAFEMKTVEQRTQVYQAKKGVMHIMAETYGVEMVPTGDAWEKVRDLPLFTTPPEAFPDVERFSLCSRIANERFKDDYSHDGDIGGGQYLNACVWFEIITDQSCIGNTFRPRYTYLAQDVSLTEEKIQILQNAAHEAVAELKKEV